MCYFGHTQDAAPVFCVGLTFGQATLTRALLHTLRVFLCTNSHHAHGKYLRQGVQSGFCMRAARINTMHVPQTVTSQTNDCVTTAFGAKRIKSISMAPMGQAAAPGALPEMLTEQRFVCG